MSAALAIPSYTAKAIRVLALVSNQHPEISNPIGVCREVLGLTVAALRQYLPANTIEPVRAPVIPREPITHVRVKARFVPQPPKQRLADIPNVPREEIERLDLLETFWDPDPQEPEHDAASCRALLLEIIRRASYDWVLYRDSTKLPYRELANEAYQWLFVEEKTTASWRDRLYENRTFTAFVAICDTLEMDPKVVRARLRELTIKDVLSVGRPAEHRRLPVEDGMVDETMAFHGGVDLGSIPTGDPMFGG